MSIHGLPAELLLPIFEYASYEDRPIEHFASDPSTSTNISQVCSRWRYLSISHQALWARVPRRHDSITKLYLSRCASGPLDVEVHPEHWQYNARLALDLIPRARSLFLSCRSRLDTSPAPSTIPVPNQILTRRAFLKQLSTLSVPDLTELWLDLQPDPSPRALNNQVEVPRHMFNDQTLQNLRSARFNGVILRHPRTFIWPNIRRLEIIESRAWRDTANFVQFFRGVPLLEDFRYHDDFCARGGGTWINVTRLDDLPPLRSVPLTNVKTFTLHGTYHSVFLALALLDIPHDALVSLTLSGLWHAEDAKEKLQIMQAALTTHFDRPCQADVYFDCVTFAGRTLTATHRLQDNTADYLPYSFTLSIPPIDDVRDDDDSRALEALLAPPIVAGASLLKIQSHADDAFRVSRYVPRDGFDIHELRCILDRYADTWVLDVSGVVKCYYIGNDLIPEGRAPPNLSVLRMHAAQIFERRLVQTNWVIPTSRLLASLCRLGTGFERLELEGCRLREEDVRALREGLGEGRLYPVDCEIEA